MSNTIGIFGHYGNLNLGDEAIIEAVIQNVRLRCPKAQLCCFSINPSDTERRHNVPSYPIRLIENDRVQAAPRPIHDDQSDRHLPLSETGSYRASFLKLLKTSIKKIPFLRQVAIFIYNGSGFLIRQLPKELCFLRRSYRAMQRIDLLLIAGSNQLLDNFGGPFGFPYTLLKWSVLTKLTGTKLAYISVGAGPLESPLSRLMVRAALSFSNYASCRDTHSKHLIESMGLRKKISVFPDLALSLSVSAAPAASYTAKPVNGRPVVGINVMPVYDGRYWCTPDASKYRAYVEKVAAFASALLHENYPVFFFGTQVRDEDVIADLLNILRKERALENRVTELVKPSSSVDELMGVLATVDLVVATRFHGLVLSLLAEKPVVGICYYEKMVDLLRDMGQVEYAVNLEDFECEELLRKIRLLEANRDSAKAMISARKAVYRKSLAEQYDHVLSLVRHKASLQKAESLEITGIYGKHNWQDSMKQH
jgi:polysaccharide pyruvyl transferase WcaK-like protein